METDNTAALKAIKQTLLSKVDQLDRLIEYFKMLDVNIEVKVDLKSLDIDKRIGESVSPQYKTLSAQLRQTVPTLIKNEGRFLTAAEIQEKLEKVGCSLKFKQVRDWLSREARSGRITRDDGAYGIWPAGNSPADVKATIEAQ